jgi:hypothetical protein
MNDGFGSPAFFFYPPMTQWVASLFAPILPGPDLIPLRVALSVTVALAVGGWGMRQWLATLLADRRAALFGALLYLVLPYHLYVDTYHRAALAELWAMAVAPWCLYGVATSGAGGARPVAALVLAIAALFLSHAPSALLVVPFVGLYALVLGVSRRSVREPVIVAAAMVVGAMIAGFYLATALTLTGLINTAALFEGKVAPTRWLIGGGAWPDSSLTGVVPLINAIQCVGGAIATWLMLGRLDTRERERRRIATMLLAIVIFSAVMQTVAARAFWALPTPFARIQFPWRLLTVQTVAFAGLAAMAFAATARRRAWAMLLLATIPAMLLLDGAMLGYRIHREAARHELHPSTAALLAETHDALEYQLGDIAALDRRFGPADTLIVGGSGVAAVRARGERSVGIETVAPGPVTLLLHRFAFTGWRSRIDDGDWRPMMRAGPVVALAVPAGRHRVTAELAPGAAERTGLFASIAGVAIFLAWLLLARRAGRAR